MIGISQRTSPNIAIMRRSGSSLSTVATVPITPKSRRYFMLMEEDYIQMEFSLVSAVHFAIGDFIDDPIFGRFRLSTEQMPKYNAATGGFDYSLKFEADYMCWRNLLHTLTTVIGVATDAVVATTQSGTTYLVASSTDGVFTRKEAKWTLTDSLQVHAQQLLCNLKAVYYGLDYIVAIHSSAAKASEVKCITYDGCSMLEAMNMMAREWECEWWVTRDTAVTVDGVPHSLIIHFGKCELSNTPLEFVLGETVEGMDVSRDQQTYANRIYAYGGTQNIPEDYDRSLIFKADTTTASGAYIATVKDSQRPLTLDMIEGSSSITPASFSFGDPVEDGTTQRTFTQTTQTLSLSGEQEFNASLYIDSDDWAATEAPQVTILATLVTGATITRMRTELESIHGGSSWSAYISLSGTKDLGTTAQNVYARIVWTMTFNSGSSSHLNDPVDCGVSGSLTATADASTATKTVVVSYNGTDYSGTFSASDGKITFGSSKPPSAFANSTYAVYPLNLLKVPLSYYTPDYDTGVMSKVGERRLHLGTTNRYVQTSGLNHYSQFVEIAVVFDKIFPRLTLRIKQGSLITMQRTQKVTHSDESVTWEKWTQYSFKAEFNNNGTWTDFPFKLEYMLDSTKLQAMFLAPGTVQSSGYRLAGMTFDVGFTAAYDSPQYTIIRNDDYGVLLPNDYLYPSEGDTFVLTGWNPKAITGLGLVASAEAELLTEAEAYLAAITDGQFTIRNTLMSNVLFKYAWGGRGNGTFGLLDAGTKVTVTHAALPGGSKTSRVIGYEYKLDMPYDTPTYVVGETEAFSRLKQIEKQLTKLT